MSLRDDTRTPPPPPLAAPDSAAALRPADRPRSGPRSGLVAGADLFGAAVPVLLIVAAGAAAWQASFLGVSWLALLALCSRGRAPVIRRRWADVLTPVGKATLGAFALSWALLAGAGAATQAHSAALLQLAATATLTTAGRGALLGVPTRHSRVLLAGTESSVSQCAHELGRFTPSWDLTTTCILQDATTSAEALVRRIQGAATQYEADAVLLTTPAHVPPEDLRRLSWSLDRLGADLMLPTGVRDVAPFRTTVLSRGPVGLVHLNRPGARGPAYWLKPALERTAAALLMILLLPVSVLTAALVRLYDGGPVLYRQTRIGQGGVPFTMFKFRTMTTGAHAQRRQLRSSNEVGGGVLFKVREDPRVTGVGKFLRGYSLDELPQLWNVICGEMALVGPRPALPEEVQQYDVDAWRRMAVPPGVTGLWQVSGRSTLPWEDAVRLDLHYVDNWSAWLDLSILVQTVRAVVRRTGAY